MQNHNSKSICCLPDPRFVTDYAVENGCPYAYRYPIYRRRLMVPYSGSPYDNEGCCQPGYWDKLPDKGYRLLYNDYPLETIRMDNGLWPLYATQPSREK